MDENLKDKTKEIAIEEVHRSIAILEHFIIEDKCIGCGVCLDVCKFEAVENY